jgi:serine/threonine protein kinase/TolB-like protein/Tfp pilus assembly protein PilF
MTRDDWRRIKEIAAAALEEPESSRAAYVASRCGADDGLRAEVDSLLDSTTKAAGLFETPTPLIAGARAAIDSLGEFDRGRVGERIGPYRIVRELGGGGMGAAYLAVRADQAFEKQVAIKVIKRGMATDAVQRRFRRERQILADLDHPNVARLLDGGTTADGLPYLVMEYVQGTPIDQHCDDRGLSTRERIELFRQVCDAVEHAHQHSVVHRDLKPSNILVTTDGHPKLLDFGISKLLTPEASASHAETTMFLRAMTPTYASPEQVRGLPITAATDVYSLGVVLYELLTGKRPYQLHKRTLREVEEIIFHQQPQRPSQAVAAADSGSAAAPPAGRVVGSSRAERRALRRELAGDLDNIVLTALRKEPERRYATVKDLSDDLLRHLEGRAVSARADEVGYRAAKFLRRHRTRVIEAGLAAAAIAIVVGLLTSPRGADTPVTRTDSVAVMPFATAGGNEDGEYLAEGLTDGLIESLSQFPGLRVLPRGSVFAIRERTADPQTIARELRVTTVLLGSMSQTGDGVSLVLELRDGSDGRRLWQRSYGGTLSGLVTLREQVARDVARRLGLGDNGVARTMRQTNDSEAYQFYLRGRYLWNKRTEDGFRRGLDYFREAIDRDPQYALAYTGLADSYNLLGIWGALPPTEAMPNVKQAALKAIEIDGTLAEAHTSLAFANWVYDWDWEAAGEGFRRALDLDPTYATAHEWYAYYLASAGNFDDAITHIAQAQQLEPLSLSINTDVGEIYYWAGQYDRAAAALQDVLQIEPGFVMARNILGLVYLRLGRTADGLAELEAANRLSESPRLLSALGYAYGVTRSRDQVASVIEELRRLSAERYTSAFAAAVVYAGAGDTDQAIAHLEQAFAERSDSMAILRVYPLLDGVRGDARFQALVARVGMP